MFIQETQRIINTFKERYDSYYSSERGDYHHIEAYEYKPGEVHVRFWMSDYYLEAYFTGKESKEEFHIENDRKESIFDYAEENCWEPIDVAYMKYGFKDKVLRPWMKGE